MHISIETSTDEPGRTVLTIVGAIDLLTRQRLAEATRGAFVDGARVVVLDLAEVSFVDSTGIGTLIELDHEAEDAHSRLVIRDPSARVRRILEMTGLGESWLAETDADTEADTDADSGSR